MEKMKETNLVIFKAVHKLMCTDAAWAKKRTAVDAVSNSVSARHAASAHNITAMHIEDIAGVQHHNVQRQAGNIATVRQSVALVTHWTLQHPTGLFLHSRTHQPHNARCAEHVKTWQDTRVSVQLLAQTTLQIVLTLIFTIPHVLSHFYGFRTAARLAPCATVIFCCIHCNTNLNNKTEQITNYC